MKAWWCLAALPLLVAYGEAQSVGTKPAATKAAAGRKVDLAKLPPGAIALKKVAIQDPGVIAPMTALNALVPAGWTARGGVVPAQGLCAEPYAVDWSATSPDGRSNVAIFPTEVWAYNNTGIRSDCMPDNFANVRDYLSARVQRTFPGARVMDYRPRPDFTKGANDYARRMQAMMNQVGMNAWADGGEILFAYTANGTEMRGVMGVTAIFYGSELANPMGGEPLRILTGSTLGTFAASAPDGQLNFQLVEAVRRSVTPDPQWLQKLFALKNQLGEVAVQGTRERAAMIVAGGAAATKSNIESFHIMASRGSTDATNDRMHRENIEAIRGVETYRDPVGEQNVQLDANYSHAWRVNNQDAYILTNDPNFNPGQYDVQATELKAVQ